MSCIYLDKRLSFLFTPFSPCRSSEHHNTLSAQEVLLGLASQIDSNQRCKFNINRSSVLDGAIRGFKRLSYNPKSQMCIKFSDDLGMAEEAVDLGGPRREFLRLLMETLMLSPMFEGRDGKQNLALDSSGISVLIFLTNIPFNPPLTLV